MLKRQKGPVEREFNSHIAKVMKKGFKFTLRTFTRLNAP